MIIEDEGMLGSSTILTPLAAYEEAEARERNARIGELSRKSDKDLAEADLGEAIPYFRLALEIPDERIIALLWIKNSKLRNYLTESKAYDQSMYELRKNIINKQQSQAEFERFDVVIEFFRLALETKNHRIIIELWNGNASLRRHLNKGDKLTRALFFLLALRSENAAIIHTLWEHNPNLRTYLCSLPLNSVLQLLSAAKSQYSFTAQIVEIAFEKLNQALTQKIILVPLISSISKFMQALINLGEYTFQREQFALTYIILNLAKAIPLPKDQNSHGFALEFISKIVNVNVLAEAASAKHALPYNMAIYTRLMQLFVENRVPADFDRGHMVSILGIINSAMPRAPVQSPAPTWSATSIPDTTLGVVEEECGRLPTDDAAEAPDPKRSCQRPSLTSPI